MKTLINIFKSKNIGKRLNLFDLLLN